MLWILIVIAVIALSYYYLVKPQLYWKHKNVKQGIPIPLFGNNLKLFLRMESTVEMVQNVYNKFKGERYAGMYQTMIPTLLIRDPDLIKQITIKDFDHFVDHRSFISENVDPIWSKNLFSLRGDEWREMRATLSPTFTASKMRAMFVLMEKSAQQFVDFYWQQNQKSMDLELKSAFTRYTNDVIANCAFGVSVDSLKEPENIFYLKGKDVSDFSGFFKNLKLLLIMSAPKVVDMFKLTMFSKESIGFFKNLVRDTIQIREEQNIIRPDMINLLMDARKGKLKYEESTEQKDAGFATVEESHIGKTESARKKELSDMDMTAQVMVFFFAGFDAISTMLSFACYELAVHPEVQEKLRKEVDETYKNNNGKLTYDVLSKMKYMDMVVSETLRKDPGGAVDRICTKSYTIQPERPGEEPVTLEPGDCIWLPIAGIHHDEEYFPNPKKFDPERFSDENKANIKPYTYIPFGSGPRNCIGSRFALMEMKTLIFHLLTKFELTVIDKTVIPIKYAKNQFNPAIEGGFWVGLKRRQDLEINN